LRDPLKLRTEKSPRIVRQFGFPDANPLGKALFDARSPAEYPKAMKTTSGNWLLAVVLLGLPLVASAAADSPDTTEVEATLNRFHMAASNADGAAYFALFAPEGVFIGTDATERWTVDEFKAYAMPYFLKGKGWTYVPKVRHVQLSPQGDIAWFDEILDNKAYGVCRGSGVLRKAGGNWLICQYHLTIPVPNSLAREVVKMIQGQTTLSNPAVSRSAPSQN
jgi:hypothetical protein